MIIGNDPNTKSVLYPPAPYLGRSIIYGIGIRRVGDDRGECWVFFITEGEARQAAGLTVVCTFYGDSLQAFC